MTHPMGVGGSSGAMLHVMQGPQQGQVIPLQAPEMKLGREGSDLDLARYVQVSRQHARLYLEGDVWSVQDLGSTNGTHVNNERIATRRLYDGDILKMGDFVARVSLPGQSPRAPRSDRTQVAPEPPAPTQLAPQNPPSLPPQSFPSNSFPQSPLYPPAPVPRPQNPAQNYPQPLYPPQYPSPPYPPHYPPPMYQVNNYAPATPPKNPGTAAVLSFFFCGLGQFYNGEVGKGVCFLLGSMFAGLMTCAGIGWLFLIPIWIWGIADAYSSAEQINRRANP